MTPVTAFWLYFFFYLFLTLACGFVGTVFFIVRAVRRRGTNARQA